MAASALLTSYLAADGVFLLIERLLLGARDVSVVEFGHRALFATDRPIFPMKLIGLLLVDLAFFQFFVYTAILGCRPRLDASAAPSADAPSAVSSARRGSE